MAGEDLFDPVAQLLPGVVACKLDTDTLRLVPLGAGRHDPRDGTGNGMLGLIVHDLQEHEDLVASLYSRVVGTKIPPFLMNGM